MSARLGIVVLLSGDGSNLQALIDAAEAGLPAEIRAVVSNRPDAYGLERARRADIPARVVDHRRFPDRASFEQALRRTIDEYEPDLLVLAGFMRVLGDDFVNHYRGRALNIHPSLLPAYRGLHTHERVLEAGDGEHGSSVHYVTPELDGGPVVARTRVSVRPDDDAESLATRVKVREHRLYPTVIDWIARGRLIWHEDGPWLDGRPLTEPVELREEARR